MPVKPIHIFQFVTNPVCAYYRFNIPAKHLNRSSEFKVTAFSRFDAEIYNRILSQADILIIQRLPASQKLIKLINRLNHSGKLVIYDIDDDLFNLPPDSGYLKKAPVDYRERLILAVKSCQAVQCSTQRLAGVVSEFHPEIVVLENQLDEVGVFDSSNKKSPHSIVIGYAAGENHGSDWLYVKDAFNEAIKALHQTNLSLEICIIGDRDIFTAIEYRNKQFLPLLSRNDYKKALQHFDISLIPLEDNKFNRSKSDIKFLESAASRCAVLASYAAYADTVVAGETGLIFKNPAEFAKLLKELTGDRNLQTQLGNSAFNYVNQNRLMALHIDKWKATYSDWIVRKDALIRNTPLK